MNLANDPLFNGHIMTMYYFVMFFSTANSRGENGQFCHFAISREHKNHLEPKCTSFTYLQFFLSDVF